MQKTHFHVHRAFRALSALAAAAVLLALAAACSRPARVAERVGERADSVGSTADTAAIVPTRYSGDVHNQRRTEACWVYAMVACIEHEARRGGDSVLLSRQWLMARLLEEQAVERYAMAAGGAPRGASAHAAAGRPAVAAGISMRNVGQEVIRLIDRYGLVPYRQERSAVNNSRVLARKLTLLADNMGAKAWKEDRNGGESGAKDKTERAFRGRMDDLLPRFALAGDGADVPRSFYYLGMRYTPAQFAESVMYRQRWRWYVPSTLSAQGGTVVLDVPDNRRRHRFTPLPMDTLVAMVRRSLAEGKAVYWEYGRTGADSDHAMAIVGLRGGKFLCLNSYGKEWGMDGYCLVSEVYFRRHTCNVGILE